MSAALNLIADALVMPTPMESRCTFLCVRCARTGSRNETFRVRQPTPGDASHFEDRCPNCSSRDIEVSAPPYQRPR